MQVFSKVIMFILNELTSVLNETKKQEPEYIPSDTEPTVSSRKRKASRREKERREQETEKEERRVAKRTQREVTSF